MIDSVATRTQDVRHLVDALLDGVVRVPMDLWDEQAVLRLFPDVAGTLNAGSYSELLWATGRIELPGNPYRSGWRWHNQVLGA